MPKRRERYGNVKCSVSGEDGGLGVNLVLQERLDNPPGSPYPCLRWWTFYPGSPKRFRRFYKYKGKFWTLSVDVALGLMHDADAHGMLQRYPSGTRLPRIIDSRELSVDERSVLLGNIICDEGEHGWGDNPSFVISQSSGKLGIWREIMIVDSAFETCTFRSTTTFRYSDYKLAINAPGIYPPWRIDNAMQEVAPAAMVEYLRVLEEISG